MKNIVNYLTEGCDQKEQKCKINSWEDMLGAIDRCFDLDKTGSRLFKKETKDNPNDVETDEVLTKMTMPEYQLGIITTSKALKLKDVKIVKQGKAYSVVQF